jgi:type I restriction enzyme S subunit
MENDLEFKKDWETTTLGEIAKIVRGASPRPKGDPKYYGGNVPRLMVSDVTRDYFYVTPNTNFLTEEGAKNSRFLEKGSVLIQVSGNPGTPAILNIDACIHDGFAGLKNLNEDIIDKEFLALYLLKIKNQNKKLAFGSTFKNLQTYTLKKIPIPLPPIPEQKQIAHILSTIQEAKAKTEGVIEAAQELKKSMMKHLFTYGPVSVSETNNITLKHTDLGLMPQEWDDYKIQDIAYQKKKTVKPTEIKPTEYVGLEHIKPFQLKIDNYGFSNQVRSSKFFFEEGDILYGKLRPYLNKVAIPHFQGICSTDIIVISGNENCENLFLAYLMETNAFLNHAISTMTGVNHPRTSWEKLKGLNIALPSKQEQSYIVEILQSIDQKIEAEQAKKEALDNLFQSAMQQLMTGQLQMDHLKEAV